MSARDPRHAYLNRRGPQRRTPMWVAATGFALGSWFNKRDKSADKPLPTEDGSVAGMNTT